MFTSSLEKIPILQGRWLLLRPVITEDMPFLFDLYVNQQTGFRWGFAGRVSTYEAFAAEFNRAADSEARFIITDIAQRQALGLAIIAHLDKGNGTASIAVCLAPDFIGHGRGVAASFLLCYFLFEHLHLRKVYGLSIDFNYRQFSSGLDYFKVEGQLKEHHYFQGRYWDVFRLALFREDWEKSLKPRLGRRLQPVVKIDFS